jgi:hypothetical protein
VPIDAAYGFLFLAMILVLIHAWRARVPAQRAHSHLSDDLTLTKTPDPSRIA